MTYNALNIPPSAEGKDGVEMLRAAIVEGGLHITLHRAFDDLAAWGVLLADVARQVARAYVHEKLGNEEDVVETIRAIFLKEVEASTQSGSIAPIE